MFKLLKSELSRSSYVDTKLKPCDEKGFAAAGVIFVNRKSGIPDHLQFLVARECKETGYGGSRGVSDQLNFLGGKRLKAGDSPLAVATTKADTETGMLLHQGSSLSERVLPLVFWDSKSKYAYYFVELVEESDVDIDWRCEGIARDGVERLEWIDMNDILSSEFVRTEFHTYAGDMVRDFKKSGVLQRLVELFNVVKNAAASAAAATAATVSAASPPPSRPSPTKLDFDVTSAILISSARATGSVLTSSSATSKSSRIIIAAFRDLHKSDVRKLQLRFHPDKLKQQIVDRNPTVEEEGLSNLAFQTFNGIKDDAETRDVNAKLQDMINDLKSKMNEYQLRGEDGEEEETKKENIERPKDAIESVADLLKEIKIDSAQKKKR